MTKMKLPDGWNFDAASCPLVAGCADDTCVWISPDYNEGDGVQSICIENEPDCGECDSAYCAPVSIALAAIRAANLDPVYVAAKALFTADGGFLMTKVSELRTLLESLEEPE
jgi:hypothetical protein